MSIKPNALVYLATTLLVIAVVACGAPTPLPTPQPTMPATSPAGAPTAQPTTAPTETPTAQPTVPSTAVPTAVPTSLPTPMPTPVPTATPPPGLAILSFTVDVEDLPPAGKRLTFHWQTTGGSQALIWSGTQHRFPIAWQVPSLPDGSLTAELQVTYYRDPDMTLMLYDAAGNSVSQSLVVPWPCRYPYFFPTDIVTCPAYEASATWAAEQRFEHGRMIWLQEVHGGGTTYTGVIIVLYDDGRYEKYQDTWAEGEPESDPAIVPPAGLYQPIRGFGKLWRNTPTVRDRLGWATGLEQGFDTFWQAQIAESIGITFFVCRFDGQVIRAGGWDTATGGWQEEP